MCAGTREGGLKAKAKNLLKDPNFYKRIGHIGGSNGTTGGFASKSYEFNAECGRRGGKISRRKSKAKV